MKVSGWRNFAFEFLSIFIAVISAFALNNWNENRKDRETERKLLIEISNGLEKDIEDVILNKRGHREGIKACKYWRRAFSGASVSMDSTLQHYSDLTRDYISIQNISGYESLKSRGLELISDDSLRFKVIEIYEYDFKILEKFEEEYQEMQFQSSYYYHLNQFIAPSLKFDQTGNIVGIDLPLKMNKSDRGILLSYLWKIQMNRSFILRYYNGVEKKITTLREKIENYLND